MTSALVGRLKVTTSPAKAKDSQADSNVKLTQTVSLTRDGNHFIAGDKRSSVSIGPKPAVEFQDGGRLFSETGSSNISAVN